MCNSNCPFFCQFHWLHFIKSHRYSWIIEKDTCLTDILYEQMTATFNLLKKCQVKMPLFWFLTQQSPKIHATLQSILKDSMRKMIFQSRLDGWRISYIVWHGPIMLYEVSWIYFDDAHFYTLRSLSVHALRYCKMKMYCVQSMSDRRSKDRRSRSAIFFPRSDRDRRSSFSQKIAMRSAIAKSMIGIAKNAIFLAIFWQWFLCQVTYKTTSDGTKKSAIFLNCRAFHLPLL